MKKLVCVLLALVLVLGCAAEAENVPSDSIDLGGMHGAWAESESGEDLSGTGFLLEPLNEYYENLSEEEFQRRLDQAEHELEKLEASDLITDYFGLVYRSSTGELVTLLELFGGEQPDIFEFEPLLVWGYELRFGDIRARMLFPTPYPEGEEVAVLVGIVETDETGETSVVWVAQEGIGVPIPEAGGLEGIETVFRQELMEAVQTHDALIAIASQHHDDAAE